MTPLFGRNWTCVCALCLGIGASIAMCGCVVGNKGVQMDSTSRMPWFNLELRERKKKSDGPAFRSVRSEKQSKSRIDMLNLFGGKKGESELVESTDNLPKKSAKALPTTDQSLVLDSSGRHEPEQPDFR
jgi:hypothetical protein